MASITKGFFSSSLKRLHSAPSSLLISQFSMFGYLRASLRRSVRDQTMNAFMGRFMCSSESAMSISLKLGLPAVLGRVLRAVCEMYVPINTRSAVWFFSKRCSANENKVLCVCHLTFDHFSMSRVVECTRSRTILLMPRRIFGT